jgi:hypothetical protein
MTGAVTGRPAPGRKDKNMFVNILLWSAICINLFTAGRFFWMMRRLKKQDVWMMRRLKKQDEEMEELIEQYKISIQELVDARQKMEGRYQRHDETVRPS